MAETDNGAISERQEGGKARSETAYPYYGLSHAIEMVQAIRKAGGKEASLDAVMKEMGIAKNTDRRWAYGVPSAMLYGLIERVGRGDTGRLKITDLALRITNPASVEAGRNAKIAALKIPTFTQGSWRSLRVTLSRRVKGSRTISSPIAGSWSRWR